MNTENKPLIIDDEIVVSLKYTLTVDGEVVDSADEKDPIQFIQGFGQIIPGLERELYSMTIGQSKKVTVSPEDGYGELDSEAVMEIPRSEMPDDIPLEAGIELDIVNEDDEEMTAVIKEVKDDVVVLDFNHPLAGKKLEFDVTVVDLRQPTEEELEHGHVHEDGEECCEEEEEE